MARHSSPPSIVDLIERILLKEKFLRRRYLIRLQTLVWFLLACWLFVSDQKNGRLLNENDLRFLAMKIATLLVVCVVGMLMAWAVTDRRKSR